MNKIASNNTIYLNLNGRPHRARRLINPLVKHTGLPNHTISILNNTPLLI